MDLPQLTVRVPDLAQELHLGRVEGIVFGELEFGGKDASFERSLFWALDESLPEKEIILADRSCCDAVGRRCEESLVLLEEPLRGDARGGHRGGEMNTIKTDSGQIR